MGSRPLCTKAHGTVMKEYVTVPGAMLDDREALRPWFTSSHAHVAGLKPKPARG
jgi:TfoX/Sxy family transcriptional regulator of competence genes